MLRAPRWHRGVCHSNRHGSCLWRRNGRNPVVSCIYPVWRRHAPHGPLPVNATYNALPVSLKTFVAPYMKVMMSAGGKKYVRVVRDVGPTRTGSRGTVWGSSCEGHSACCTVGNCRAYGSGYHVHGGRTAVAGENVERERDMCRHGYKV